MDFDVQLFIKEFQLAFGKVEIVNYPSKKYLLYLFNEELRLDLEVNKSHFLIGYSKKLKRNLIATIVTDSAKKFWKDVGFIPIKDSIKDRKSVV